MPLKNTGPIYYSGKFQPFAKSIVSDGPIVFVSGSSGRLMDAKGKEYWPEGGNVGSSDISRQTWDALDKIRRNLEAAGAKLENLLGLLQFVRADNTLADGERVVTARIEYFRKYAPSLVDKPPTTTMVGVSTLFYSDMKIEILAWACIPQKKSRRK